MFLTIAIGLISTVMYGDQTIKIFMGSPFFALLMAFTIFLITIKRDYVYTFFDTRTCSQYLADQYLNDDRDEHKIKLFTYSDLKWRKEIGDDVKTWLADKLPVWLEEQPIWFKRHRKASVPHWVIDDKDILKRIKGK